MATPRFYPHVHYWDADAGIRWLTDVLGGTLGQGHRNEGGCVVHAELSLRGATIMVSSAGIGREPFRSLEPGGRLFYCALDEVDELYEQVRAAGADVPIEITDTSYGSRDFTVRDPEGNLWAFGTYGP